MPQIDLIPLDEYCRELIAERRELLECLKSLINLVYNMKQLYNDNSAAWIMRSKTFQQAEATIAKVDGR